MYSDVHVYENIYINPCLKYEVKRHGNIIDRNM